MSPMRRAKALMPEPLPDSSSKLSSQSDSFEAVGSTAVRYLNAPTQELYFAFADKKGFEPVAISLSHAAKVLWLGDQLGEKILVFFHGKCRNSFLSSSLMDQVGVLSSRLRLSLGFFGI